MDKSKIKIGTSVLWSGCFNGAPEVEVEIEGIFKERYKGDKNGDEVSEISWEDKDNCVFDLDNGHWCYGNQIHEITGQPDEEEEQEVRITFRSEVYIKGKSLKEIKRIFEEMPLFSADAKTFSANFIEVVSGERVDDKSYKDITNKII